MPGRRFAQKEAKREPDAGVDGNMEKLAGGDARPWSFAALRLAALLCAAFVIISLLKRSAEMREDQVGG